MLLIITNAVLPDSQAHHVARKLQAEGSKIPLN